MSFIHLRVHSAYSLAEGAIKIKDLVKLCQKYKMPAVAITDTANLFGALEFSMACADAGIQPIIGCQIHLKPEIPSGTSLLKSQDPDQLVLLAQTEEGYLNLLKLLSQAYLKAEGGDLPVISLNDLQEANRGLICFSGGPRGPIGKYILQGQLDHARETALKLSAIYPHRFYMEIMRHGLESEEKTETPFLDLAYDLNIPLVATNEAFFDTPDMYEAHDALLCVAAGTYVAESNRRRLNADFCFKSQQEMIELFSDIPEAIQNTVIIAKRCSYMPTARKPILPPYPTESGRSEAEELRVQATEGLEKRLIKQVFAANDSAEEKETKRRIYIDRLNHEIAIIEKMGFPGYFLIVSDFIKWAKSQNIPVGPGRGSGAGSLVAWSLTITDIDPIRFSLLFERFLNPERVSMPDFDVDFCQDRRDEVISYVLKKYGSDRVAHIITFGKLQARAVLRDVGRVLQMPYGQVDKICKLVPNNPANPISLPQAIEMEPLLQQARDSDQTVETLIDIGIKLEGLYRHASTHAAGVVIGDRPLYELVPLYKDERSELPATQFNMKYVEQAGLVKFDFLGLKTLTVIEKCCELIRQRGIDIDISQIPLDDQATFDLLSRVETVGIFQVESAGMRDVLRKLRPDRFEDLIALVALYRPGPMDDIPRYLACKHGEEEVTYLHPDLKPILEATYGVMVYQEQVMQIAQVLGGYTLGAADLLRRAMGKKIKSEMDAQRALFVEGAVKKGVKEPIAIQIFDQMAKFAGYGFNKSHSAPYALLTYQTAYLKANYPVEFFAASMTYDLNNTDKLNVFRQDMERFKIPLLPPDINASNVHFKVEAHAVRYALAAIKNVGEQAMEIVVAERYKNGSFKDLSDFTARLDQRSLNKRQLENLISAGAFDSLCTNRKQLYDSADHILKQANLAAQERQSQQNSLFGNAGKAESINLNLCKTEDWPSLEKLQKEFEALGFYLSAHPLDIYGNSLEKLGVVNSLSLADQPDGVSLKVAGILLAKQERTSKTGQKFAFIQLSDSFGVFEVAVFSEVFQRAREHLVAGIALMITCTLRQDGEGYRLTAQSIDLLENIQKNRTQHLKIILTEKANIQDLKRVIDLASVGTSRLSFQVNLPNKPPAYIQLPGGFQISSDIRSRLLSVTGISGIEDGG